MLWYSSLSPVCILRIKNAKFSIMSIIRKHNSFRYVNWIGVSNFIFESTLKLMHTYDARISKRLHYCFLTVSRPPELLYISTYINNVFLQNQTFSRKKAMIADKLSVLHGSNLFDHFALASSVKVLSLIPRLHVDDRRDNELVKKFIN